MIVDTHWKQEILHPLLRGQIPQNSSQQITVVSADINQAQRFVFESSRLPDIRGASRVLAILNEPRSVWHDVRGIRERVQSVLENRFGLLVPDEIVYLGGGGLIAILPHESDAFELKAALETIYPKQTGAVTMTVVCQNATVQDVVERFGFITRRLQTQLKAAKLDQTVPFYERLPFERTCFSCQTRPAVTLDPALSQRNEEYPLCHICLAKVTSTADGGWGGRERSGFVRRYLNETERIGIPNDLGEIGEQSGREIGLIYADGDGVGDWLFQEGATLNEFREKSARLRVAVETALSTALADFKPEYLRERNEWIYPIEIIVVGGDDVLMIVPANRTLKLAVTLVTAFQTLMSNDGVSMSVGIALGSSSTPVQLLYETATDLLKSTAKRRRAELRLKTGFIDFHDIIREGLPSPSIKAFREQREYQYEYHGTRLFTTGRPYRYDVLAQLIESAEALKLPESLMHALSDTFSLGQERSTLYYLYQCARMKQQDFMQLQRLEKVLSGSIQADSDVEFPWLRMDNDSLYTPLRDLVLLRKLVTEPLED